VPQYQTLDRPWSESGNYGAYPASYPMGLGFLLCSFLFTSWTESINGRKEFVKLVLLNFTGFSTTFENVYTRDTNLRKLG
jgi:hypothetical protein